MRKAALEEIPGVENVKFKILIRRQMEIPNRQSDI